MEVKFRVNETSKVVGKTGGMINTEYGVQVVHLLRDIDSNTLGVDKFNPTETVIEAGNYLEVRGDPEKILRLSKDAV